MAGVVADYVLVRANLDKLQNNMNAMNNVLKAQLDHFLASGAQMSDTFVHAGDSFTHAQDFAETRDGIHAVGQQIQATRDAMSNVNSLGDMASRLRPDPQFQAEYESLWQEHLGLQQAAQDVAARAKEATINVRGVAQAGQTLAGQGVGAVESAAASAESSIPAAASSLEGAVTEGVQVAQSAAGQGAQVLQAAVTQGAAIVEENPAIVPAAGAAVGAAAQTVAAGSAGATAGGAAATAGGAAATAGGAAATAGGAAVTAGATAEGGAAVVAGASAAEGGAALAVGAGAVEAGAGAAGAGSTLAGGSLFGPIGLLVAAGILAAGVWFATHHGSSTPAPTSAAATSSGQVPAPPANSVQSAGTTGSTGPASNANGSAPPPAPAATLAWAGQYALSFSPGETCDTIPVPVHDMTLSASGTPDAVRLAFADRGGSINASGSMTSDYTFSVDGTTDLDGAITLHSGGRFDSDGQNVVLRNGTMTLNYVPSSNSGGSTGAPQSCSLSYTGTKTGG